MLLHANELRDRAQFHVDPIFRRDVLSGLSQLPRSIPPRWFYDLRGSELFEMITEVPEYYPSRTERAILEAAAPDIAALVGRGRPIVEFGSGSSAKTPIVLSAIEPSSYIPIDISGEFLSASAVWIRKQFPELPVHEVEGDFTQTLHLPRQIGDAPPLGFFPGSTIGNFVPSEAVNLLRAMSSTLGRDSMLLIGIDRVKEPDVLVAAYDDAEGVTASFNLNLLERINRELNGTVPIDAFRHFARWNEHESRIEMHLEARHDVEFSVEGRHFEMRAGQTIHTENSVKYAIREARLLLRAGGWDPIADWTDELGYFSLILARASDINDND